MSKKQKMTFDSLNPETQVVVALAYSKKKAKLTGTIGYAGTYEHEMKELLEKMGAHLSEDRLKTAIESDKKVGLIQTGIKPIGRKIRRIVYYLSPEIKDNCDIYLKQLGWLKEELKSFE